MSAETGNSVLAERALEFVKDGDVVGLGSGRAATAFVRALGQRVRAGLRVRGVPTSETTARLARDLGIPLVTLADVLPIDVTVDGADEVDPQLNLIKGLGGALVREKIVASASRRLIILIGAEKLTPVLGTRGALPVEVVPFGAAPCARRLLELGLPSSPRQGPDGVFVTDNGNHILDCRIACLSNPTALEQALETIPGVVGTGLFLGMAETVLVQDGATIKIRRRGDS